MKRHILRAALMGVAITSANAAAIYTDDFNTDPLDGGWNNVVGSNYTQSGGVLTATTTALTNSISVHSGVVSTIQPFNMTVDFTFDALSGLEDWAGLIAHAGGTGLGGQANDYLVFRVRGSNGRATISTFDNNSTQFNLAVSNGGAGSNIPVGDIGPMVGGNAYRLTLSGDTSGFYTGKIIDLDGGDGGTPGGTLITMTNTTAMTPLAGGDFGLYSREVGANDLHYDNFSVTAVPEPASAVLLGLTGLVLLRRRRS